ncbi:hypothetical protein D3C86_1736000 [compost metagenome]
MNQVRRDDHQQLAFFAVDRGVAEKRAKNRDVAQSRKLADLRRVLRADQTADHEALAVGQRDAGVGAANGEGRDGGAADGHAIVVIELTDFGGDLQGDPVIADHGRGQCQANPELLVFD